MNLCLPFAIRHCPAMSACVKKKLTNNYVYDMITDNNSILYDRGANVISKGEQGSVTRRPTLKGAFAEEEQVAEPIRLDRPVNNRRAVIWQKMKSYLYFA